MPSVAVAVPAGVSKGNTQGGPLSLFLGECPKLGYFHVRGALKALRSKCGSGTDIDREAANLLRLPTLIVREPPLCRGSVNKTPEKLGISGSLIFFDYRQVPAPACAGEKTERGSDVQVSGCLCSFCFRGFSLRISSGKLGTNYVSGNRSPSSARCGAARLAVSYPYARRAGVV